MTEVANQYLGNSQENVELSQRLSTEAFLEVHLSQSDCAKGRIHAHTDSGVAVGIIKSREFSLQEGDIFQTESGKLVSIHLQPQKLMVLSFSDAATDALPARLVHLGHVLGNHHWPIIVQKDRIYIQLAIDTAVMESTINDFHIPGLKIGYESRSPSEHLNFFDPTHPHH